VRSILLAAAAEAAAAGHSHCTDGLQQQLLQSQQAVLSKLLVKASRDPKSTPWFGLQ